jgi:uncharacterized membrane protein YdbT with pleckstrin-like domain
MSALTIQPTTKFLKAGAALAALLVIALEIVIFTQVQESARIWLMFLPLLFLLWPAVRYLRWRFTKATIAGDRLRYETGLAAKSTRTIQLTKIQDVRVDQQLVQRMFNIGDLSIETAGESSRLTIHNVDDPQTLADDLMSRAQKALS